MVFTNRHDFYVIRKMVQCLSGYGVYRLLFVHRVLFTQIIVGPM